MFCKDYKKVKILIDKINYYTRIGDFYTKTEGGGSSIKGAVVGSVIAGELGATVGSRQKIKTKQIDNRITIINVIDKYEKERIIVELDKCSKIRKIFNNNEELVDYKKQNKYNEVIDQIKQLGKLNN